MPDHTAPDQSKFDYGLAFDRNLGLLGDWEQQSLRGARVAISGMGGVGGFHLVTLARLGIANFNISDLDRFEVANFNRQIGATMQTLGRPKVEVLEEMARAINPDGDIRSFPNGVDPDNIDSFLAGADLYVDGLDFFVLDIRRRIFARCAELGIPAVTAAPLGMGCGFLAFLPGAMTFEEYFRFEGRSETQQYVRFLMGLSPKGLHRAYLVDPGRIDLQNKRGPSTVAGVELCAAITGVAAVKLLLGRGGIEPAPCHHHFDAYRGKLVVTRLRHGNAGPIQRLKIAVAERIYGALARRAPETRPARRPETQLEQILDAARWAPSGDNAQPWRFRIAGDDTVDIYIRDDSATNVYEFRQAEPSVLAGGTLLESLRIAASAFGRDMTWRYDGKRDGQYRIAAKLPPASAIAADPLYRFLPLRQTCRRPFSRQALHADHKQRLSDALGADLRIDWWESPGDRRSWARLGAQATDIRLRMPEAFPIHQRMIDWRRDLSPGGIPAKAVGLDRLSRTLMRWGMGGWGRMRVLNRLGATVSAGLQMDILPGLFSAGFFAIRADAPPATDEAHIAWLLEQGARIQRFWLTATQLGLSVQPAFAILGLAHYGDTAAEFTADAALRAKAERLARRFAGLAGRPAQDVLFVGRIGYRRPGLTTSRSTRYSLDELLLPKDTA